MLAIRGIYDGKQIRFEQPVTVEEPVEVIVTFLGETQIGENELTGKKIAEIAMAGRSFDWLNDPEKDGIYTDEDGEPI